MNNTILKSGSDFKVMHILYNNKISKIYDIIINFRQAVAKSKNAFELHILVRMMYNQIRIIQSQPIPKYKNGGVIVGDNKRKEVVINKYGAEIEI